MKSTNKETLNRQNDQTIRPPIVVVLGHIDHGKTTLLDFIRKTRVAPREAGGITQRIGAYQVAIGEAQNRKITFIDTPGHAAFAKMRARGAQVADVAVLVVAADDGVMPQTKEAIAHARAAKIPFVVALNKIDLRDANPARVKSQLAREGIIPEDQGGDTPVVAVSARTGEGVPDLLEMVSLVADLLELRTDPKAAFSGVVIESALSPQQGPLGTVVVKEGTLRVGAVIHAGEVTGKVKALISDRGQQLKEAGPGMPVGVVGFSEVPPVGSAVEEVGKQRVTVSESRRREGGFEKKAKTDSQDLNVILRTDTQGSLEAITNALSGLKDKERGDQVEPRPERGSPQVAHPGRGVNILFAGVGQITDSDIYLAQSAGGVVLGFNVRCSPSAEKLASDLGVGVRSFEIIYELLEVVESLLKGVGELAKAKIKGEGEVIKTFTLHSEDVVLGVRITAGKIKYRDKVRVIRISPAGEEEIHQGYVRGLKIGKAEVPEAKVGESAGILIKPQAEFAKGDRIIVV